nr:uncharacterized protein LOC111512590 [Leptinotarsa decemlineata]
MFHGIDKVQVVEVTQSESMINLSIKTNISDFKIKYEVTLTKTEDEKFMEMMTIPMIQTIHFLEIQQKMLCKLIEKKDRELEEYQMEKGAISRSDLITGKFEANTLVKSSRKLILNTLGNSEKFMDHIKRKFGEVEEDVVEVVAEVWNEGKKRRKIFEHKTPSKNSKIVFKE